MPPSDLHEPVLTWYAQHARDLPWRAPDVSPWAVLVSEVMLQQTPVRRVLPVYETWVRTWPAPADLAAAPPGDAVRAWSRLGYPRRALRLHAAANAIVEKHDARVPSSYDDLLALPGIGPYTAAAVAAFAFGKRHAVLDTNVRRVLARVICGTERPGPAVTAVERKAAEALVPEEDQTAATWAVAVMELGALVCSAQNPSCRECPLAPRCAWHRSGNLPALAPRRPAQRYVGSDRQVRGLVLASLRASPSPMSVADVGSLWRDQAQLSRAVEGLRDDGLIELVDRSYCLPGERRRA